MGYVTLKGAVDEEFTDEQPLRWDQRARQTWNLGLGFLSEWQVNRGSSAARDWPRFPFPSSSTWHKECLAKWCNC